MIAGILAKRYGPVFGGLFLAFPAIFPASSTLVEKQETEKKRAVGIGATSGGRKAAALDARGASIGSIGLIGFALVVWKLLPIWHSTLVLFAASVVWIAASTLVWRLRRHRLFRGSRANRDAESASRSSTGS